tara:strand:- start:435 stop:650 length:216 start_codon:yes stop_codon:yes gene_type:complete
MEAELLQTELDALAEALGYERIQRDEDNDCWAGTGSSDPTDRSRDDLLAFVAFDNADLRRIAVTIGVRAGD